ncbi:hypothetical protein H2201_008561 [Coniosporium apollinis]|uniref:SWI5-dependent HO expression protein 3 n=1 Tax=Coniosporium apollinis TaxID=61459 RepID=A0ABQ9NIM0_9PEZI|nr:hypothetical protein H2201_008561 [Coniosporium apollinis]
MANLQQQNLDLFTGADTSFARLFGRRDSLLNGPRRSFYAYLPREDEQIVAELEGSVQSAKERVASLRKQLEERKELQESFCAVAPPAKLDKWEEVAAATRTIEAGTTVKKHLEYQLEEKNQALEAALKEVKNIEQRVSSSQLALTQQREEFDIKLKAAVDQVSRLQTRLHQEKQAAQSDFKKQQKHFDQKLILEKQASKLALEEQKFAFDRDLRDKEHALGSALETGDPQTVSCHAEPADLRAQRLTAELETVAAARDQAEFETQKVAAVALRLSELLKGTRDQLKEFMSDHKQVLSTLRLIDSRYKESESAWKAFVEEITIEAGEKFHELGRLAVVSDNQQKQIQEADDEIQT